MNHFVPLNGMGRAIKMKNLCFAFDANLQHIGPTTASQKLLKALFCQLRAPAIGFFQEVSNGMPYNFLKG